MKVRVSIEVKVTKEENWYDYDKLAEDDIVVTGYIEALSDMPWDFIVGGLAQATISRAKARAEVEEAAEIATKHYLAVESEPPE
jgi:hypothetical protein